MKKLTNINWDKSRDKYLSIIKDIENRNGHLFSVEIDEAMNEGTAFAFSCGDDFVILKPFTENGIPHTLVMFAFNQSGNAINTYQPIIDSMARDIGSRTVQLYTKVNKLSTILECNGYAKVNNDDGVCLWCKILQVLYGWRR